MNPFIKGIVFVIFIMILASLLGCHKDDIAPYRNAHLVLIDINNDSTYTYSDLTIPTMGWVELKNGEGKYSFTITNNIIEITSSENILKATHLESMYYIAERTPLEVSNKNTVRYNANYPPVYDEIFEFEY